MSRCTPSEREAIHFCPAPGPCQVHGWPTEGLAKRLIEKMRAMHGKGGVDVCCDCIARAKQDADAQRAKMREHYGISTRCHSGSDGDCSWAECPQLRDGEPGKSGRHCPLDADRDGR